MNKNEILDKIFRIFEGGDSKETLDDIYNELAEIMEEDNRAFKGYKPIPEFYQRLNTLNNKKELILSALKSDDEKRKQIGSILLQFSTQSFFSTDEIEELLNSSKLKELHLDDREIISSLIHATGHQKEYFTQANIERFGLNRQNILDFASASEDVQEVLTPEIIEKFKITTANINEVFKKRKSLTDLTPQLIKKYRIYPVVIFNVLEDNGKKLCDFFSEEELYQCGFSELYLTNIIEQSGNIEKYLTPRIICKLEGNHLVKLIIEAGIPFADYFSLEKMKQIVLTDDQWESIISWIPEEKRTQILLNFIAVKGMKAEDYLTSENKYDWLTKRNVIELIKATGKAEKYLTPENIKKYGLKSENVVELITSIGKAEEYLTPENIKKYGFTWRDVAELIKSTGSVEKYLKNLECIQRYGLNARDISYIVGFGKLFREEICSFVNDEIRNGTYIYDRLKSFIDVARELSETNSGRLNRIIEKSMGQIARIPLDKQYEAAMQIKHIYETKDIPLFAQNFLVFKQLHSRFMGEENYVIYSDEPFGDIPSLNNVSPKQRNNIIFSDLAKISVESNNRDLQKYLNSIEQGNRLFEMFKAGNLQLDETLSEDDRVTLKKYSNMLNTLYNQTSKGKRLLEARVNSGNLEQDLTELDILLNDDENIHIPLCDRIVRTFGYWAGIRSFEQAKKMIEEITKQADKTNRETAEKGEFSIKKGYFVKGIYDTKYFPQMLQNGIVARDYLGENAAYDATPLDTDVELIQYDEKMFTAPNYTSGNVDGKALGKIILVMKNDGRYVKTRDEAQVDEEAVKKVIEDRTKIEYFDNNGIGGENAYGIRTGIGSTNISFIIADRYIDKLGLEIAMNGFYIPIIDKDKNLLYTPEMYDEMRSKMQGLSHYGLNEFQLDSSAKNIGTNQIANVIKQSKEDAENKREAILQTLRGAIELYGLNMSEKRTEDLLQGTVEVIDTGSTGRGTNLPGDGDFDFMVRLDGKILNASQELKQLLEKSLCTLDMPSESIITAKGDFRFKDVSIDGLKDKVDIDLSFTKRTDEIEYTTEECIKDRLETIRKNNPEDYKCVVANILLAKTVLKSAGAYKKKSSPEPQNGQEDTRGGLGAVGIENWILQNGGSFEKAARDFLEVARECFGLSDFQQNYAIWDFGENYMAGDHYSHDNFVYNMNDNGYSNMVNALEDYIRTIENERKVESGKKGLGELVQEDMSVLNDTQYMMAVEKILESAKHIEETKEQESVTK